MQVIVLMIAFLVAPVATLAADGVKPEPPALTVAANGTVAVAPDTAFVSLGMETAGKSLTESQSQNSAVMQKVMERLRGLKIEKERIQTSSFTVSPHYKPPAKRPTDAPPVLPEIIGYTVSNTLTVEVRELDKVASVIEEAMAAGANHFHGLHWGLRDEQPARLNALKHAAAKAREKAGTLGEALNVKLVRLMNVTEGSHVVRPAPHMARAAMAMEASGSEVPISSGEIKVEATVTLVYEIASN
jgi:uncharacterized protein YggE